MATRRSIAGSLRVAIAAGAILSACGAPSAPSVLPPQTTSPLEPSASAAVIVDLGVVGITLRGSRVTVHSFGPSDRSPEPPRGSAWFEADVEWCLPPTIAEATVGQVRYELALELSDGTTIEPDGHADSPDEVYASEGTFSANECVRGALVFAVPTGATPDYLLHVVSNGGMRWALA